MKLKEFEISQNLKNEIIRVYRGDISVDSQTIGLNKPFNNFFVNTATIEGFDLIKVFDVEELGPGIEKVYLYHR